MTESAQDTWSTIVAAGLIITGITALYGHSRSARTTRAGRVFQILAVIGAVVVAVAFAALDSIPLTAAMFLTAAYLADPMFTWTRHAATAGRAVGSRIRGRRRTDGGLR